MGSRGSFRRLAGTAVSARRTHASLALCFRVVRAGRRSSGQFLSEGTLESPRPLRRAFLLGYLSGFLWYMGNCYWVRDTMSRYGDMPPLAPTLLLVAFSLVLGLYFGLFGLGLMLVRRATKSTSSALAAAPFLWTALDLLAARFTSVPWDQLGYSQVDNGLVNQLAPWTGVYGITFLLRCGQCVHCLWCAVSPQAAPSSCAVRGRHARSAWLDCAVWQMATFVSSPQPRIYGQRRSDSA